MDNTKMLVILTVMIIVIFTILTISIVYDSGEDLVGENEEVKLFMVEAVNIRFYDREGEVCVFVSAAILFDDMDIMFDYVREVCHYNGYLIFESEGITYITNASYTIVSGTMIDNTSEDGGILWGIKANL